MKRWIPIALFCCIALAGERGVYFAKKRYEPAPLPAFAGIRERLPEPIYDTKPGWIATYWRAWELACRNFHEPEPGSGFVSQFIDAAFSESTYFWDTCFMSMFTNVAHPLVPGVESLDNFYAKQRPSGEIGREINRATGLDYPKWVNAERRPYFSRWGWAGFGPKLTPLGPNAPVVYIGRQAPDELPELTLDTHNHPIAAWAELESYRVTGDLERLRSVRRPLEQYYRFLQRHLRQGNGLYITDWASMDDSPRNPYLKDGGTGVDISSEMVLFAGCLAEIALLTGDRQAAGVFKREAAGESRLVRERMWDAGRKFFVDLTGDGRRVPIKTIAGYWPLLAGIADKVQARALAGKLQDPATFGTRHRVPSCSADEPAYRAGGYWQGATWAPTNTMVIRGLERYGYHDLARAIAVEHVENVSATFQSTGTIWENYSPNGPAPGNYARKNIVGWSAIGPILYLLEYGIGLKPDAAHNRLKWRVEPGVRSGCRRYRFNGHVADLIATPSTKPRMRISVTSDGPFELRLMRAGRTRKLAVVKGSQSFEW
jgi:glycogen debranching enzyme